MRAMNIWQELHWRELIADCTDAAALQDRTQPWTLYCGFDPTADSLHVGHLVPLLALRRFQQFGHHPIAVAGGATGCIGDPSGKSTERPLLTKEQIRANLESIRPQLERLLDFESRTNPARLLDNADWTASVTYLDFLRDIGKHFSINQMLAKESVRARLEDREAGLSYTEFSYMLLQAYDFYILCRDHQCELQIGGSDQWGNITAGIDLIRKKLGRTAYGLTLPLVTKADGTKFGKTESGSVWLDPNKTSPYRFYQFWINTDDRDVIRYLKYFTFLSQDEIGALEAEHQRNPGARTAHRALARAVTELVHGLTAAQEAVHASEVLFGGGLDGIPESTFREIMDEVPTLHLPRTELDGEGAPLVDLIVRAGLAPSKSQARKDIEGGGIYVNNVRENRIQRRVRADDLLFGRHLLLRKGRKHYVLITAE
ncbi:MAG: tyrosine--tRNA ligase 1 [Limisphaera sp.]|nr:MAG: tyrosine--tRNA ligase 1 [Limisphaera sp.]